MPASWEKTVLLTTHERAEKQNAFLTKREEGGRAEKTSIGKKVNAK